MWQNVNTDFNKCVCSNILFRIIHQLILYIVIYIVWIHCKWNKHLIFDILQLSFMLHVKHFIRIIIMFNLSRNIDNFKKLFCVTVFFLTIRFKIHWKFVYCQVLFLYHWHAYLLYLWQTFPSWNLILAAYYVCTVILWITNAFWMIAQGYVRL